MLELAWMTNRTAEDAARLLDDPDGERWTGERMRRYVGSEDENRIAKVLHYRDSEAIGVILYRIGVDSCRIYRIAVKENQRRRMVGTYMVHSLTGPVGVQKNRFTVLVPEYRLDLQLFFRKCGFRCDPKATRRGTGGEPDVLEFNFYRRGPNGGTHRK